VSRRTLDVDLGRAPASGRRRGHDRPQRRHRADFMMLNPLSSTHAPRAAVAHAIAVLHEALHNLRR
jgi:hypothetical protein